MKEFLEKFGLTEILAYLFPGAIGLCALLLWGAVSPGALVGTELGNNQVLLAVLVLILAYAVGLVLSMWGLRGVHVARRQRPFLIGRTWPAYVALGWSRVRFRCFQMTAGMPPPNLAEIFALDEIRSVLVGIYRADELPLLEDVVLQVSVFRSAATDRLKEKVTVLALEADILRRRYMFAVGSAFALVVLSVSALFRLAAVLAEKIPMDQLSPSAAWRTSGYLPFAFLILLIAGAVYSVLTIWKQQRMVAGLLLGACAISLALSFVPRVVSTFPLAGAAVLAAACIAVCVKLRNVEPLARTLTMLFSISVVCLIIGLIRYVPMMWLYEDLAYWQSKQRLGLQALLLIAAASFCASLTLRSVAARCWEHEVATTLAIVRLFGHHF